MDFNEARDAGVAVTSAGHSVCYMPAAVPGVQSAVLVSLLRHTTLSVDETQRVCTAGVVKELSVSCVRLRFVSQSTNVHHVYKWKLSCASTAF